MTWNLVSTEEILKLIKNTKYDVSKVVTKASSDVKDKDCTGFLLR